ncbi:hypothetical protein [Vulcanisaeta sp. JCM 14467]
MNCWLVFVEDCSRPCNCLSEHPLILSSNPGIAEGDYVIIVDKEMRTPCCIAVINNVKSSKINGELRVYAYLKDCDIPIGDLMNRIMKVIRSVGYVKIMNVNQYLCAK